MEENQNAYPQQSFFWGVLPSHCFQKVMIVFHLHVRVSSEEHAYVLRTNTMVFPFPMQQEKRDMVSRVRPTTLFEDTKVATAICVYHRGSSTLPPGKPQEGRGVRYCSRLSAGCS